LTIAGRTVFVAQSQPPATTSAPGAPRDLVASVSGANVTLNWSPPDTGGAPSTYVIAAGSASGWSNLAHLATGNTLTTFSAAGIPNGVYFVRVSAQNAIGTSAPSNEVTFSVGQSCSAPAPPSALQYTINGSMVTLNWTAHPGGAPPTSYIVEAGSSVLLADLAVINTGSPGANFAAIAPPGVYFVRVRAATLCAVSAPTTDVVIVVQP
jgi:predicted phage tail protein